MYPVLLEKYKDIELKDANISTIRGILNHAESYNSIYKLENIEMIILVKSDSKRRRQPEDEDDWFRVFINDKYFDFRYYSSSSYGTYQFRIKNRRI